MDPTSAFSTDNSLLCYSSTTAFSGINNISRKEEYRAEISVSQAARRGALHSVQTHVLLHVNGLHSRIGNKVSKIDSRGILTKGSLFEAIAHDFSLVQSSPSKGIKLSWSTTTTEWPVQVNDLDMLKVTRLKRILKTEISGYFCLIHE